MTAHPLERRAQGLVAVAACAQPVEAHLIRCRLEAEGLDAFVADEHIVSMQWLYSPAVGGVKVQVHARDADRARAILDASRPRRSDSARFVTDDLRAPRCPDCGSLEVQQRFSRRITFASSLLLGFPLPWPLRRSRCRSCGAHWRAAPRSDSPSEPS
jgi:hypothetical protein